MKKSKNFWKVEFNHSLDMLTSKSGINSRYPLLTKFIETSSPLRSFTITRNKILEVPELKAEFEKWPVLSTTFLDHCKKLEIPVNVIETVPIFGVDNICLALQLEIAVSLVAYPVLGTVSPMIRGWFWTKYNKAAKEYFLALKCLGQSDIEVESCKIQLQKAYQRIEELSSVCSFLGLLDEMQSFS